MKQVHYTLYREGRDFVAQCLDFDVSSFGASRQEALAMLKEAIELYLEDDQTNEPFPQISDGFTTMMNDLRKRQEQSGRKIIRTSLQPRRASKCVTRVGSVT